MTAEELAELRRLAEAALPHRASDESSQAFVKAISPQAVLSILDEIEHKDEEMMRFRVALANTREGVRTACHRLLDKNKKTRKERLAQVEKDLRTIHEYTSDVLMGSAVEEEQA